ncbi:hypothetical protein DFH28DRAFT_1106758 [Melampsora americana]|nr:hypothetical protein DFH28DRAFT_1106758 [Melampsora americana]
MLKSISPFTFFSIFIVQSIQCLPNFRAVEEGGHFVDNFASQINRVADGNQMMVDHAVNNFNARHPVFKPTASRPKPPNRVVPQSQPVLEPIQYIQDVNERIQSGYKPTINEISATAKGKAVRNLNFLRTHWLALKNAPPTQENLFKIEYLGNLIRHFLQKPLDLPFDLMPQGVQPTLVNVMQARDRLSNHPEYAELVNMLNTRIDHETKTPLPLEEAASESSESVGSTTPRDELNPNEEVNSQLRKMNVVPSYNQNVASKRPRRIHTFDLNKRPDEDNKMIHLY